MVRDLIKPQILDKLKRELKDKSENAIKVKISKLKSKYRITSNAAAQILAEMNNTTVMRYLEDKDKDGLRDKQIEKIKILSKISKRKTSSKIHGLAYSSKADKMMEPYKWIFCLENTSRDFLRDVFKKEKDWIDKRLEIDIKKDIERAKKEPYYAHEKRKDDLEYATLGHLLQIIISNKNWKDILPRLKEKDKKKFIATFEKVLPSRNATGHCIYLKKRDRKLIESRVIEITLMFEF